MQARVEYEQRRLRLTLQVDASGIPTYLLHHPFPHVTLDPRPSSWPAPRLVRHNHLITSRLARRRWHSTQVGPAWPQAVIPVLELAGGGAGDKLLIGAGGRLVVHPLTSRNGRYGARTIEKERVYTVTKKADGSRGDIVGIAPLRDGQVIVAQFDGTVQRLSLSPQGGGIKSTAHYASTKLETGKKAAINTLAHDADAGGDWFMTTTSAPGPCAQIYSARSPWKEPLTLPFPSTEPRAWSSLIHTSASGSMAPSVMLGLSSHIAIYDFPPTGPPSVPSRILTGPDPPSRSSAYDIHLPPPHSAHHPSLLLSAWFDSHLRLHDLRSPSSEPIIEFSDPWTWADGSAMYSSTFFGEYGIAGGGARHGTVCLFDIRNPKQKLSGGSGGGGWSVFSPGGKGSPVYSLRGEGGRIWGVTEKRAFVLAFDGSGDQPEGILSDQLMAELRSDRGAKFRGGSRGRDAPSGWKRRGGRWSWTVRYDEDDGKGTGYEHSQRGVQLFDGLPLV